MGTMAYKHDGAFQDPRKRAKAMTKPQINLKLIPGVDGQPAIAELTIMSHPTRVRGHFSLVK
jgi:acetoacetate decarboxylase